MAIKTYKKGTSTVLAPNFKSREFDCLGKGCCAETPIDEKLVEYLQNIRDHFGKPVELTAYRCPTHNAKVPNAAKNSRHLYGQAADFHIDGVSPTEIAKYAESIGVLGIGLYDTDKDGHFVHIDTRTTKSFWKGHAGVRVTTFGGAPVQMVQINVPVLRKGDTGESVKALQRLLGVDDDGIFGGKTEEAVESAQAKNKLPADGVAGIDTWSALVGTK